MATTWWGRCCESYYEAVDIGREFGHVGFLVKQVEECEEHASGFVIYVEKRAWHKGFKPDHVKTS